MVVGDVVDIAAVREEAVFELKSAAHQKFALSSVRLLSSADASIILHMFATNIQTFVA